MTETSQSTSQRERRNKLQDVIEELQDEGEEGAPREQIMDVMTEQGDFSEDQIDYDLQKMCRDGNKTGVYEPITNEYRVM